MADENPFEHTANTLDVDTAVAYADDPDVEIVDAAVDPNAEHGENPELIDEGDVR
jgi:hypothetical protein